MGGFVWSNVTTYDESERTYDEEDQDEVSEWDISAWNWEDDWSLSLETNEAAEVENRGTAKKGLEDNCLATPSREENPESGLIPLVLRCGTRCLASLKMWNWLKRRFVRKGFIGSIA